MSKNVVSPDFEEQVRAVTRMPPPDPQFVEDLWSRLDQEVKPEVTLPERIWLLLRRPAWAVSLAIILVMILLTLAIGPARVLAQVQRLFNYVPGIGFIDLDQTRVLASSLEVTRKGVTLRVEQVVAGPERTQILISSPGLSEAHLPWPNPAIESPDLEARVRLPDGSLLEPVVWEASIGRAEIEFPPLPANLYKVTLLVPRLPLVPAGALPENWEIPLTLRPATGELVEELFPQPYSPQNASDTHHGVTLRVLDVAQGPEETAIRWQMEWTNPKWEYLYGSLDAERMPELNDDLGHYYWETVGSSGSVVVAQVVPDLDNGQSSPTPPPLSETGTSTFSPLSLAASQATLRVHSLAFQIPAEAGFTIELGENPQIGDTWALDVRLDVAGLPVRITSAQLVQEQIPSGDDREETRTFLAFDTEPLPKKDDLSLRHFSLQSERENFSGSGGGSNSDGSYTAKLNLKEGAAIPAGSTQVKVVSAWIWIQGPWEITWQVQGSGEGRARPVELQPVESGKTRNGVALQAEKVMLSDRLTAIQVGAGKLPAGASLNQVLSYNPANLHALKALSQSFRSELYLEDNRGRRYAREWGGGDISWQPSGGPYVSDPTRLIFPPLEPLARRVTLHVPAVELFLPGQVLLTVDVPPGVVFKPVQSTAYEIGSGGGEREVTVTDWLSDPWEVDIPVEIGGYSLHFTQARLQRNFGGGESTYRSLLEGKPLVFQQGEQHLSGLHFSELTEPAGKTVSPQTFTESWRWDNYISGGIGTDEEESRKLRAWITLDVTSGNRFDYQPGRYLIELDGVTAWVPGPWEVDIPVIGD